MPLINCEMNLILTWSENCVISNTVAIQALTFAITDTKLCYLAYLIEPSFQGVNGLFV